MDVSAYKAAGDINAAAPRRPLTDLPLLTEQILLRPRGTAPAEGMGDRRFSSPPPSSLFSFDGGNWAFFSHGQTWVEEEEEEDWWGESSDMVKQALLCAAVEVESVRVTNQEQIQRMECEIARLRDLVGAAARELGEAREQAERAREEARQAFLLLDGSAAQCGAPIAVGQDEAAPFVSLVGSPDANAAPNSAGGAAVSPPSPSSGESSAAASSAMIPAEKVELMELVPAGKLPEKGRLLEAVMKAGPLLQNLMLAGPLPQWRHPPPPLRGMDIPPVFSINGEGNAAALTSAALTTEETKPINVQADRRGLLGSRKRGAEDEGEGEPARPTAWSSGHSPPSSSSSSPKMSSIHNIRGVYKHLKIGA